MRTTFACTACGGTIAASNPVGTRVRCPLCQAIVVVPETLHVPSPATDIPPPTGGFGRAGPGVVVPPPPSAQGSAIGALVCGIIGMLGCAFPVGLVGLILGIVGARRASREPHRYGGKGMAISGIVLGGLSLFIYGGAVILSATVYSDDIWQWVCRDQLDDIHSALYIYAWQSNGYFPDQEQGWESQLTATGYASADMFWCASDDVTNGSSYFYVPGYDLDSDPNQIIVYEHPLIHDGGAHILRIDGTVEFVESAQLMDVLDDLKLPDGTHWAPHKRF